MRQARTAAPLLPLRLLANRPVGLGNLVQVLMVAGLFGYQFLGVLYLQQLLGYDPLQAGLAYLPVPLVIAAVSLGLSARLITRFGIRTVLVTGLALITAGLALLTHLPAAGAYLPDVLPAGLLIATGFGLAFPALAATAVGSAPTAHRPPPTADAGVASGLFNTTQQVGGALGLAFLTRLATADNSPVAAMAQLNGYHLASPPPPSAPSPCSWPCQPQPPPGRDRTTPLSNTRRCAGEGSSFGTSPRPPTRCRGAVPLAPREVVRTHLCGGAGYAVCRAGWWERATEAGACTSTALCTVNATVGVWSRTVGRPPGAVLCAVRPDVLAIGVDEPAVGGSEPGDQEEPQVAEGGITFDGKLGV